MKISTFFLQSVLIATCVTQLSAKFPLGDPPDATHPWGVHDHNRPQPPLVVPGKNCGDAPSDAIVLFDGTEASLTNWVHTKPKGKRKGDWLVKDGALQCVPGAGYIQTKEEFGDCQLHVEWMAPPVDEKKLGQSRGNSGVFLMGQIEVQVLDNYQNSTYADGTAGAVYGVMPPAANPLLGANQWQSYDIIFRRPIVKGGALIDEGSMTVLINGVVVQDSTPLDGGGGYKKRKSLTTVYPDQGPLSLQDHGNPVRFRNIWYRPLRPRATDGGTEGRLSAQATAQKRAEIAVKVRERGAELSGYEKMTNQLEAYLYDNDPVAWVECDVFVVAYVDALKQRSETDIVNARWDIVNLYRHLTYLQQFEMLSKEYPPADTLKAIADSHNWLKKK